MWKFCGKAQFPHSFRRIAQNYAERCLSAKFPHQEIRWNYGILRSVPFLWFDLSHGLMGTSWVIFVFLNFFDVTFNLFIWFCLLDSVFNFFQDFVFLSVQLNSLLFVCCWLCLYCCWDSVLISLFSFCVVVVCLWSQLYILLLKVFFLFIFVHMVCDFASFFCAINFSFIVSLSLILASLSDRY